MKWVRIAIINTQEVPKLIGNIQDSGKLAKDKNW